MPHSASAVHRNTKNTRVRKRNEKALALLPGPFDLFRVTGRSERNVFRPGDRHRLCQVLELFHAAQLLDVPCSANAAMTSLGMAAAWAAR